MPLLTLKPLHHRGAERIGLYFEYDPELQNEVKRLSEVRWSQTHRCWHLPLTKPAWQALKEAMKGKATLSTSAVQDFLDKRKAVAATLPDAGSKVPFARKLPSQTSAWKLSAPNMKALEAFVQQLKLKAYSPSTIKTYRNEFLQLLQVLKAKPVDTLTQDDLKRYMVWIMEEGGVSEATAHSRLNAIKFYFEQVLKGEKFYWEIPRPKKALALPRFFNQDEITRLLSAIVNLKHKTMVMLAYSAGLRVSEVVNIKTKNIDSQRMCLLIEAAKGKKDRMVSLSPVLLVMLREYWKATKPNRYGYLFEGQGDEKPYSSRSLQLILAAAKRKAGITKPGSIHALRHSFATHLLDKGTDVTIIMKLLGHNDLKTTLRYLHVTNRDLMSILSPLDDLKLN